MFTHTLNSAVLDLSEVPCLRTSASPCARSLSYLCGDKAYGFSRVLHVQIEDSVAPLTPGPQVAVVGDLGVPQGLKTIQSWQLVFLTRPPPAAETAGRKVWRCCYTRAIYPTPTTTAL